MGLEQISSLAEDSKNNEELFKEKVSEISGIPTSDLVRRNETIFLGDNEEGSVDVIITSISQLEEDLSMMDLEETILGKEEYKEILKDVCYELVKKIGEYVPEDKIHRLFPGLDLSDLDSYDFSRSKIKLFVLSPNDYQTFFSEMFPDRKKEISGARTFLPNTVGKSIYVNKEIGVDLSENKLIILNERMPETDDNGDRMDTENISDEKKETLRDHVKRVTAHELIHLVDVAADLPQQLREGITEWYAQQIINHWYDSEESVTTENFPVGYSNITPGISILFNSVIESGVDGSIIDKAFISNDEQSRQEIYNCLSLRYGEEAADKIWNWSFKKREDPLKYIADLESKQDSKMGEFLRNHKVSYY